MKLRPKISGCSVRMKTPTRHSGKPAWTRRSQVSAIIRFGLAADLAPSMSQSVILCRSVAFMRHAFAAQVPETSRRYKRPNTKSDSVAAAAPAADLPAMPQEMIGEHAGHHG